MLSPGRGNLLYPRIGLLSGDEVTFYNGRLKGVKVGQSRHGFFRAGDQFDFFREPGMATGIRIDLGRGSPLPIVDDEPLGIEHAENGHVAFGHLLGDEVLVASQLGTVVATHRFVEGGGVGVRGQSSPSYSKRGNAGPHL